MSTEAGRHKDAWSSLELDYKNRHPDAEPAEEASKYLKDNLVSVGLEAVFMENKGFLAKEASIYAYPVWFLAEPESLYAQPVWYLAEPD